MTPEMVMELGVETFRTVLLVAGPMLLGGFIISFCVSIFQAVTSIQDMTLTEPANMATNITMILNSAWKTFPS